MFKVKLKKTSIIFVTIIFLLIIMTVALTRKLNDIQKSDLQKVTNTSKEQSEKIEKILNELSERISFVIEDISHSDDPYLEGLDKDYEGYEIITSNVVGKRNQKYLFILKKEDKSFIMFINCNYEKYRPVYDIGIDAEILPSLGK